MRILIDMDGVIADFEKSFLNAYKTKYPDNFFVPLEERTSFHIKDQYPKNLQLLVEEIYCSKGFYFDLLPIEGSINALNELSSLGNEVYICTSPLLKNRFCISEKYNWVLKYLGNEWAEKMIVTKDKTIIQADYLIDDNPNVTGVEKPTWEHILYSQPYNLENISKRRITWKNWEKIFDY